MIFVLTDGEREFQLDIPMSCGEITLNDYHELKVSLQGLPERIAEDAELSEDLDSIILDAVSKVVKGDLSGLAMGNASNNLLSDLEGDEITVYGIYGHVVKLISEYEPKPSQGFVCLIDGEYAKLQAKYGEAAAIAYNGGYTAGEYLTYMEYSRRIGEQIEMMGDIDGNFAFTLDSTLMAILFRKEGEALPSNKRIRERFISNRAGQLGDMPLDEYFNAAFFFASTVRNYMTNPSFSTSSTKGSGSVRVTGRGRKRTGKRRK